ncbi:SulP family inorganic anion transporter [Zeaxanthinibacter enoshimensis]|uniref:SulP family sulfate permease n=1 Tax=Zeaxanthinibacter enoshimensis TaxID=392009 RepID=A0A4R6TLM8_9FLAO|nr:solute carrier family 26 protein [Zeaxanthinibacter enoshimensis]TDQ29061.1 SulP family sulfate permease [Zeaxanthinibacter enoshimensis]
MQRVFPILDWLGSYKRKDLPKDLLAGLTIGIVLIPQGMAYAMIAGLPPVYGLYAAVFPIIVYTLLGTSRQLGVGPVAMDSILLASGLGALSINGIENYIALAILLTFMVGALQFILGISRMGFLVNFLSRPVISGFTSAAAIIIIFSQLKHLLGTEVAARADFVNTFIQSIQSIPDTHVFTLVIGLAAIVAIILLRRFVPRIPGILIVVVLAIIGASAFDWIGYGVEVVGAIPEGLPTFNVPSFSLKYMQQLFPTAITLAVIGFTQAISIAQSLEEKNNRDAVDPNKELIALGSANIIGSFFQSYTVTASFSRTAINYKSGAQTLLSLLVGSILVILTLLFLTPIFYFLPNAILAAIIMVSVVGLIEINYPRELWKHQRDEFYLLLATFLATLIMGILQGIVLGVLFSLILMLYRTSKPHFAVLGKIRDSEYYKNVDRFSADVELRPDLLIVRFDGQLFFGNKNYFKKELSRFVRDKGKELKCVILNSEAINYIDSSATSMLIQLIDELHRQNISFYMSGAIGPTRDIIFNSGIIDKLPKEHLFLRIQEAVDYYDKKHTATELQERIAYQRKGKGN